MPAPDIIIDLVERFDRNLESYKNGKYNETQVRNEFINPFFEALGWDVINKSGYAEAYKDVIHEYSLKSKGVAKAPDYLFRIGGTKKFFVEAKKPSVNLKDDISPAFQLRRYAWSAKLPLSILTDFEEFAVYDCRVQPKKNDKSSTARIKYLTYKDYIDKWEEIESIFSKDAILKGSFDKYAETGKGKRGTTQVDDAFLSEIEKWRELLARNIALRNPNLTNRQLNYSVQKIIDRIIFLRISEDRGIEDYGQLYSLLNGLNTYKRLQQIFTRADEKYNSGLFHFDEEKNRTDPPDEITPTLTIDDKVLKEIFKNLYYPDCPYEFSVLGTDILGHVYEQFLGKVIRLTAGHRAVIEEKPEVKKAGGVYYTPTYIVDYIVKNTVGKKLEELENKYNFMPDKVEIVPNKTQTNNFDITQVQIKKIIKEASKLKILDPACGSGSFLLGAYQYLLDWHLKIYTSNAEQISNLFAKKAPPIYRTKAKEYRLTTNEKKRILLNNIYGVDIDNQAVEVTKLSLLLKVLEGETDETLNTQITMFKERALPDLSSNIKCGNSLIGPDFYDQMEMNFLDEEEKLRINVFDWKTEFEEIMTAGGFDCVIGNPPYGAEFNKYELRYFQKDYKYQTYNFDSYIIFLEKSINLLISKGYFGMIIPNTWLLNEHTNKMRIFIFDNFDIKIIYHFLSKVFPRVTVDTQIFVLNKLGTLNNQIEIIIKSSTNVVDHYFLQQNSWKDKKGKPVNIFSKNEYKAIIDKMNKNRILDEICKITQGTKPYQKGKGKPSQTRKIVDEKPYTSTEKKNNLFVPLLRGSLINRYQIKWNGNMFIKYGDWLAEPRYSAGFFENEKIVIRQTGDKFISTLDNQHFVVRDNLYTIRKKDPDYDLRYILAILNSKLMVWFYQNVINYEKGEALAQIKRSHISVVPIAGYQYKNKVSLYNKVLKSVDRIIDLNKKVNSIKTPQEKTALQRQMDATDKQIDKLVYELYGLTEEEIKIVEESIKKLNSIKK